MRTVYRLYHQIEYYEDGELYTHTKQIAFLSTRKAALKIIEKFRHLPGFCDYPYGFKIDRMRTEARINTKTMVIWRLTHTYIYDDVEWIEGISELGVYSSSKAARKAMRKFAREYTNYAEQPEGFEIDKIYINRYIGWQFGF